MFKINLLPILFLIFSLDCGANEFCKNIFKNSNHKQTFVQTVFQDFVKLRDKSEIFVQIEKPKSSKPKHWLLLIHGLLDSHRGWDQMLPHLIKKDYGVIRMDLCGHGATLCKEYSKQKNHKIPLIIDYKINVKKINLLINWLKQNQNISHPIIVGHSMGGGLALALAAESHIKNKIKPLVFVMAPYIYRLDKRAVEKNTLSQMTSHFIPPIFNLSEIFLENTPIYEYLSKNSEARFRNFFIERLKKLDISVDQEHKQLIELYVQTAIATTNGMKDLNSIKKVEDIPSSIQIVQFIGDADHLMDIEFQLELLQNRNSKKIYLLKDTGHMMTEERPNQLSKLIHEQIQSLE